jgi:CRISPR-associated protein Csm2
MSKIVLDFTKDKGELFNKTAKAWAEKIERTKKSQVRNFYDRVMELENDAKEKAFESVLPFVKMLNSKVAYAQTRGHASKEFVDMMNQCIDQIDSSEKLRVFKLFFEAVLGFYKGRD